MKKQYIIFVIATIICFTANSIIICDVRASEKIKQISAEKAKIYEKPSEQSRIIAILKKGDTVLSIQEQRNWHIVKLSDDRLGWAHQSVFSLSPSLQTDDNEAEEGLFKEEKNMVVRVESGIVRSYPLYNADVEFGLKKGDVVSIIETKDQWHRIRRFDGKTGWAHQSIFSRLQQEQTTGISAAVSQQKEKKLSSKDSQDKNDQQIKDIRVEITPDGIEKAIFTLNGFYPPDTFAIEEKSPKIVCDFYNAGKGDNIAPTITPNGRFIKRIRTGLHGGAKPKFRAVIDLDPRRDYEVKQEFFKENNLYILTLTPAGI